MSVSLSWSNGRKKMARIKTQHKTSSELVGNCVLYVTDVTDVCLLDNSLLEIRSIADYTHSITL